MYLEIKDLTVEERDTLQNMFCDRLRPIHSIYTEVCRVEAECSLDLLMDNGTIESIPEDKYNDILDSLAEDIGYACENNIFQELCETSEQICRDNIKNLI